jgi:predicted MFS family arabinose efflux permease
MNAAERRLISYIAAAHGLVHVMELVYPALLGRIEDDFGVRSVVSGGIATLFGWAFGSSAIPSGFLVDRMGSRQVMVYAFLGGAVMATLAGLAPNEWFLAAALFGLGLTIGLYHPAGLSATAQGIRQRQMALGLHGVAGNVGQALAPAVAVGLAYAIDWRAAFFFVAALSAALGVMMALTRLPVHGEEEVQAKREAPAAGAAPQRHALLLPLLVVYAGFVLSGMVYRGAITFLPKHLEELVNEDFGAAFVTVALLMGAVGQLAGGYLSNRVRLERLAPLIALATMPPLALTALLSGGALVIISSVFVFLYFMNQPVFTGLIADYAPEGAVGRSFGISFFAGFGIGSLGGVIAGAFVDQWDTEAAFLAMTAIMGGAVLVTFVIWLLGERRGRRAVAAQPAGPR